jgi:cell division protein FtsL
VNPPVQVAVDSSQANAPARTAPARPDHIRPSSRPSAARAAAAARLVAKTGKLPEAFDPGRVGEGVRHLRVVEPRKLTPAERRRRAHVLLGGGVTLLVAVVFGLVYMHVVLAQRQFAIDRLNTKVHDQQAQYHTLRLQVAQLGSPQNIIATAEGQLGMVQPASVNYLTPNQSVGSSPSGSQRSASSSQAPAGDANWPQIKSQLAGSP